MCEHEWLFIGRDMIRDHDESYAEETFECVNCGTIKTEIN